MTASKCWSPMPRFTSGAWARAQILAGVVFGSAEGHRQKRLLLGDLVLHVGVVKELFNAVVIQDLAVEDADGERDRGLAADAGCRDCRSESFRSPPGD